MRKKLIIVVCLVVCTTVTLATKSAIARAESGTVCTTYGGKWNNDVIETNVSRTEVNSRSTSVPLTIKDAKQVFEKGVRASKNKISVVNLQGTWYEMGRQYGMLMKSELEEVYTFVQALMENNERNDKNVKKIVQVETKQTPYRILEFMRGASETSGLTIEQMQEVNAVERIAGLPKCSAAFCWGEYADGPMVIGRNYDYSDVFFQLKDDVAITVYHPADGSLAVATIGYVGEIYAVNALNEKGIFMELNNGKPSANIKSPNMRITGTTMLFSSLFETDGIDDWELFFNTIGCNSSYIINIADGQKAFSYEWCPVGVKEGGTDLPDGLMVSTNYYVNPDWLFAVPSDAVCWNGQTRRNNLINLCNSFKGKINDQKMMEIVSTTIENGGAMNELTVYQMVVIPETKMLWLRVTGGYDWLPIDLDSFLQ
jgi:hypothetical protein